MKIIGTDNHDRDYVSQSLWLDNIPEDQRSLAERICERLDQGLGDYSGTYYKIVPDDHKLYIFEGY